MSGETMTAFEWAKRGMCGALCALVTSAAMWGEASACEPIKGGLDAATLKSDVIVYGTVNALEPLGDTLWSATIEVERSYKGKYGPEDIVIVTSPQGADEVDWSSGRKAMIYAREEGGTLKTDRCMMSAEMKLAPLAAESRQILPVPPGDAPLEVKLRRASAVFTGKVAAAGKGFAGRWEGVLLEVQVDTPYKGVKKREKLLVRLDEDSCGGGGKRDLLSDDDVRGKEAAAPFTVGQSYLFFTFDEQPRQVLLCHDDMMPVARASSQLSQIKTLCKGGSCKKSGHDELGEVRAGLKALALAQTKKSLVECGKLLPLYGEGGAITGMQLEVRVRPSGQIELLDFGSQGSIGGASVYNELGKCVQGRLSQWEVPEQSERPDVRLRVELEMKDASRGPKFESESVTLALP